MLHAVIIVSVLAARGCHAATNSSAASMKQTTSKVSTVSSGRRPAAVAALVHARRSASSNLLDNLRRQLMRDNYDYQNTNTDDERPKERQMGGSKNLSYVQRTANNPGNSKAQYNTYQARVTHKQMAKQKTAFRFNPIAPARAPELHNPYDATYSSNTGAPLGPSYSPERGDPLTPLKRRDEPDTRTAGAGPVVRAGDRDPPPAVQHPYELPSESNEAQDWRSVQKLTATFGVKSDKSIQRPVKRSEPIDHPIAEKDLLYYMDDVHLRRKNDVSAELAGSNSEAEEPPYSHSHARHHATGHNRRAGGPSQPGPAHPAEPNLSDNVARFTPVTEQESPAAASVVSLTDSTSSSSDSEEPSGAAGGAARGAGGNSTYKVLQVRRRHGARRAGGGRRLLEERGARGVALIRLDGAPFPQFRLPRARRQYMRDHLHARPLPS